MSATVSVRVDAKQRLLELMQNAAGLIGLADGAVTYSQPRVDVSDDAVWLGDVKAAESDIATPMKSGRRVRNDAFTIEVEIAAVVKGDRTGEEADARAIEVLGWLEDIIADGASGGPTLGALAGVLFCHLNPHNGPDPVPLEMGSGARITVPLYVSTQLR